MWLVITEVRSKSFRLVTERCHDICLLCAVGHMFPVSVHLILFIKECGIACAVCVLSEYSTFGYHPQPLGYPCAKFRFRCALHCWDSPRRKIAYSINDSLTQSLTYPADLIPRELKLSHRNVKSIAISLQCNRQWMPLANTRLSVAVNKWKTAGVLVTSTLL